MRIPLGALMGRRAAPAAPAPAALQHPGLEVIEMIARNEKLERVLTRIGALVETLHPGLRSAVLLLRNGRLYHVASGGLAPGFVTAVDGLPLGSAGSREGAPFWSLEPAMADIATEARWEECREAALAHGLALCWSAPVLSATGEVLGAVTAYGRRDRGADGREFETLATACRLAAVTIEQRNLIDDLAYQAGHDALTRVPNRYLFGDRLQQAIRMAGRTRQSVALLNIDLDRFGSINDLLGHRVGDLLLEQIARRLESAIRKTDTLARTGGDEFTLVLPAVPGLAEAVGVAEKIRAAMADPFPVRGHELFVTACIGISLYPDDAPDGATMEQNASDAMFRAKAQGRGNIQPFTAEMNRANKERLEIERRLHAALEHRELRLDYQPQFDVRTGALAGAEALLRWSNPALGMVSPAVFVPVAEECGLIVGIGSWVLREACRQRARWGAAMGMGRVAVNVSALQFARADFTEGVAATLAEAGLDASLLELELTESAVMQDVEAATRQMHRLRALGLTISMDDFGTGYSSLSYLQRLPFEAVKIDQSFVREIHQEGDRPPLVQSIIEMAHALGKRVIAEGVETDAQLRALDAMKCELAQGYLLGRPGPPERLPGLTKEL